MKLKHLFFVLVFCLALTAIAVAQDAPEATAEATVEVPPPAELPPVEATEEPTLPPPTEEPTVEVTVEVPPTEPPAEVTEEPPVESTVEVPPVEVTAEPTTEIPPVVIAPEPPIGLLYADNFESGDVSAWVGGVGWIVLPGQMQAIDSNEPLTLVKGVYFNAVALARVQVTSGSAQVSVRASDVLGYTAAVDTLGNVTLSRAGSVVQTAAVALGNPWIDIRLSAIGSVIRVAVNGNEVIVWNDEAPLPPGSVTISANFAPRTDPNAPSDTLTVEDFALFVPVEELPPPTAEPTVETPVVEVTTEATVEPTDLPVVEATAEPTEAPVEESVVSAAIEAPVLKTPLDLSYINTNRPTLSWKSVAGANRYRVDVNTAANFAGTAILTDRETGSLSLALNAANLPTPLEQDRYYWRVQGKETSSGTWGPESDTWEFTVDLANKPSEDQILTVNTDGTARPKFEWATSGIANAQYTVQVDDNADFSSVEHTFGPVGTLSYTPSVAEALDWGNYYWRVLVNGDTPTAALNIGNYFIISPAAAATKLLTPTNNLNTYDNTWGFTWEATTATAGGPFGYQIQVNTVNNFNGAVSIDQPVAATNYDAGTLADGVYWWRVRPVNAFGVGKWTSAWKFTIDRVATPKSPLACTTDTTPLFSWDGVPGATQFRLVVDNDVDLLSPVVNVTRSKTQLSYTVPNGSNLAIGHYYWRVDFAFEASAPFTFIPGPVVAEFCVTPTPLKPPKLLSPANNAVIQDTTLPLMTWETIVDGANNVDYHIQVATNANFPASSIIVDTIAPDATFDDATVRPNGNYWWRVKTVNFLGAESGSWSSKWKFTLDTVAPAAPTLKTPADGDDTIDSTPTFSWNSVPGGNKYQILVGTITLDSNCTYTSPTPLLISTNTALNYTPPAPLLYTPDIAKPNYCWQVRAVDPAGNASPWSQVRKLIVVSAPGIAPVPNRYTDNTPTLTWTPISWADTYEIEIYKSPTVNSANLAYSNASIPGTATSHDVNIQLSNGTYYWRVRAVEDNGGTPRYGNWSGPGLGIFQVESP